MLDPGRRHLIAYLAAAAVLVVIAGRFIGHAGAQAPPTTLTMAAPQPPPPGGGARPRAAAHRPAIWVHVAGAVRRPGLYRVPRGSRVAAALASAGGPLRRAEVAAVNLAAKLADGQQVLVPERGRAVVAGGAGSVPGAAAGAGPAGVAVSLSSATPEQLEQLDGIGPALAARIIEYREAHGGFRSVDELQEVPGIGEKRLDAIRASVQP